MAIRAMCIEKVRDTYTNELLYYELVDENGNRFQAKAWEIKEEIKSGRYDFLNLQIDKAGRLVDKKVEKKVSNNKEILSMLDKDIKNLLTDKVIYLNYLESYDINKEHNLREMTSYIKTILYSSQPGVMYIITKYNMNKGIINQCKDLFVSPGRKMWEKGDMYTSFHNQYNEQLLGEHNDDVNRYLEYMIKNKDKFDLSRAIMEMRYIKNHIHECLSLRYTQNSYKDPNISLLTIPNDYDKAEKILLLLGKLEIKNKYSDQIEKVGGSLTDAGKKIEQIMIDEISKTLKLDNDFVKDIMRWYVYKYYSLIEALSKARLTYKRYIKANEILKKNKKQVEIKFDCYDNQYCTGYNTSYEVIDMK